MLKNNKSKLIGDTMNLLLVKRINSNKEKKNKNIKES